MEIGQTLSWPFRGVSVTPTNVEARIVNDPDAETIFVAVN